MSSTEVTFSQLLFHSYHINKLINLTSGMWIKRFLKVNKYHQIPNVKGPGQISEPKDFPSISTFTSSSLVNTLQVQFSKVVWTWLSGKKK